MAVMFPIAWKKLKVLLTNGKHVSVSKCYHFVTPTICIIFYIHHQNPRTEQSDANQFTVAGRLQSKPLVQLQFNKSDEKKTPPKTVLKSQTTPQLGLAKSPSMMVPIIPRSPTKLIKGIGLTRSISVPGEEDDNDVTNDSTEIDERKKQPGAVHGSKVTVPKVDDESFSMFFTTNIHKTVIEEGVEIGDFDAIKATEKLVALQRVESSRRHIFMFFVFFALLD